MEEKNTDLELETIIYVRIVCMGGSSVRYGSLHSRPRHVIRLFCCI